MELSCCEVVQLTVTQRAIHVLGETFFNFIPQQALFVVCIFSLWYSCENVGHEINLMEAIYELANLYNDLT